MYIYQNGKLYAQEGDKLVGVEIHPDHILKIKGTETELAEEFEVLTPSEVRARYQIMYGNSYIFPVEKNEVVKNEPTGTPKATSRKSTRK